VLRRLLEALRVDPSLRYALVDWIDPDSNAGPGGAEDIEYLNGNPPHRAANRPLASVEELRLVRGFDAKTVAMLAQYVTVLPVASTLVNVNTASPVVLAALVNGLDIAAAERIAEELRRNPIRSPGEFARKLPGIPAPSGGFDVKTDYFLVTLDTSIGRHERRSEALLQRLAGGKGTELIWHRPHPLIELNETDESRQ